MSALVVPGYLSASDPWQQSGKSGTKADWDWSRSHVAAGIDRDGSFLDIGCANGYLMECLPRWTDFAVEPYGLEISPELAALARRRLPHWAERIWAGNALTWIAPCSFTYVRTGLEYVPAQRRGFLAGHLLQFCERLIVGVFNEHESERTTEDLLERCGYQISGRSERVHATKAGMRYRVLWIDRSG